MKNGSEEHHKSPGPIHTKKHHRWPTKLKKSLKNLAASEAGLSFVIAGLSILVITILLCSHYLSAANVIQSEISPKDIIADKTLQVEDPEETEHMRYEAKQLVAPIYKHQAGTEKVMANRQVELLEDIQDIRDQSNLSENNKIAALHKLFKQKVIINPNLIQTILTTPEWQKIYDTSLHTMENLVAQGITSDQFRVKKETLIRQAIPENAVLSPAEREAVVFLVGLRLRPTLVIDEKSTEEAREIAASRVKPVLEQFNKGDVIVRKGEKITSLQRAALQQQGHLASRNKWLVVFGISILSVSLLSIVWGYLYRFEHSNFFKPAYAGLLATVMTASVGGLAVLIDMHPNLVIDTYPIAILSLMVCIFTHPRIAMLATMMTLLLCGLTLQIPLESLSELVISSLVGIFVLARKNIPKDRNDMILAGLGVGLSKGMVIIALSLIYQFSTGVEEFGLFFRFWTGLFSGFLTGILTLGVLPIMESCFKLVTPFTLLELGNHDRPMLRRLQLEAPGTFHHSVMVATLSEAAAEAIGANPILTRVGALYHDIGKIKRPLFFVENQAYFGVENPHDKLSPRLSKMVITAHPRDGIELAKQLGLPKALMRFMPEHHGTLTAGYFYNKAVLQEGEENVNKAQFRYPGPKPQSKETAIVMLADACESSVRALKNPTLAQVEERVDKIIKQRIDDNQFSECPITFQDIQIIRDTFIRILRGIQHNRIEYQQNVLEELSKKPALESLKQVSQTLSAIQQEKNGDTAPTPDAGEKQPAVIQPIIAKTPVEPLIELDSLAELQHSEQNKPQEPDCC